LRAAFDQLGVRERERRAADPLRPGVGHGREVGVERAAQPFDGVGQRVLEVPVAPVPEAVAGHVDRRAEAPAVEQFGERRGLGVGEQRRGHGEAALVELRGQVVPVEGVDA